MKHFISFLVLTVLFVFTSCSLENEEYYFNNQEVTKTENNFKTAVVTYDLTIEITAKDNLRTELNVQKSFVQSKNSEVWLLKGNESTVILEELIALSDEVVSVQVAEGEIVFNDLMEKQERTGGEDDEVKDDEQERTGGEDDEVKDDEQEKTGGEGGEVVNRL